MLRVLRLQEGGKGVSFRSLIKMDGRDDFHVVPFSERNSNPNDVVGKALRTQASRRHKTSKRIPPSFVLFAQR